MLCQFTSTFVNLFTYLKPNHNHSLYIFTLTCLFHSADSFKKTPSEVPHPTFLEYESTPVDFTVPKKGDLKIFAKYSFDVVPSDVYTISVHHPLLPAVIKALCILYPHL